MFQSKVTHPIWKFTIGSTKTNIANTTKLNPDDDDHDDVDYEVFTKPLPIDRGKTEIISLFQGEFLSLFELDKLAKCEVDIWF